MLHRRFFFVTLLICAFFQACASGGLKHAKVSSKGSHSKTAHKLPRKHAAPASYTARISCSVSFTGPDAEDFARISAESGGFSVNEAQENVESNKTSLHFDEYTLESRFEFSGRNPEESEPSWVTSLTRNEKGSQSADPIFYAANRNLKMGGGTAHLPYVIDTYYYLEGTYQNTAFSRVDISCELNRVAMKK